MYVRGKRNETEDMELFGGTVLLGVERGVAEGNWGEDYWLKIKETTVYLCSDGHDLFVKENVLMQ